MSAPRFDRTVRAARERRIRERRRAKLWRRVCMAVSLILLVLMAGFLGTGVWLMLTK